MKSFRIGFTLIALMIFGHPSPGQKHDFDSLYRHDDAFRKAIMTRADSADLYNSDEILRITILSDFKNLIKRKYEGEYQPATLVYHINDTVDVRREIEIKPRGNMRRKTCYFPPVTLNFPKKEAVLPQIREFDKMKMVVECKRGELYQDYLLGEYYAYRIYNLITSYSFRARLIELTMADANDKMKAMTSYAFLIESIDQLADRMNAVPIETENVRDESTEQATLAGVYVFQYLIGNTDWSIPALHNIKLIKSTDPARYHPVVIPYDFDYSGIVDAEYAIPSEQLGIESVRERLYRGVCIGEEHVRAAVDKFIAAKENIYRLYEQSLLKPYPKRRATEYLDEFYRTVERESGLKQDLLDQCR